MNSTMAKPAQRYQISRGHVPEIIVTNMVHVEFLSPAAHKTTMIKYFRS